MTTKTGLYDFRLEYTFQDDRLAELDRQISLILTTRLGSMPLERELGISNDFVDKPPEVVKNLYTAEVTKQVAKYIPWVRVQRVKWEAGEQGQLIPRVVITNA